MYYAIKSEGFKVNILDFSQEQLAALYNKETAKLAEAVNISVVMTVSMPVESVPESIKQYM